VRTLKSTVLPFDDVDFSRVLDALATRGFILRYECDGEEYGVIPTFCRHQAINNRESPSELPPAPEASSAKALARAARVAHASGACTSGKEGKGREHGKERKGNTARVPRADGAARFDAHARLVSLGADAKIACDWLTLRNGKRATTTKTAIAGIQREAAKAGITLTDALRTCCERSWVGFRASWIARERDGAQGPPRDVHTREGVPLWSLDDGTLNALARELGIAEARPGESMQAYIGRIQAAQNGRGLH
jgi:hypothetical protein